MSVKPRTSSRSNHSLFRILDANLNRAREGLRVCEEVARMALEDSTLTRRCQHLRYALERVSRLLPGSRLMESRNSSRDVGRPSQRGIQAPHRGIRALASANAKRVQEALRVLEEFSRMSSPRVAQRFGGLRFRAYALEQAFHSKFSSLCHR